MKGFQYKLVLPNSVAAGYSFASITTFSSAVVDECDGVFNGGYPGPLKNVLEIQVEEFSPLTEDMKTVLTLTEKEIQVPLKANCRLWVDIISCITAQPYAIFSENWEKGKPAITVNNFGKGKAWYIGTEPEKSFVSSFNVVNNQFILNPSEVKILEIN
jgi:beta-galactosidase